MREYFCSIRSWLRNTGARTNSLFVTPIIEGHEIYSFFFTQLFGFFYVLFIQSRQISSTSQENPSFHHTCRSIWCHIEYVLWLHPFFFVELDRVSDVLQNFRRVHFSSQGEVVAANRQYHEIIICFGFKALINPTAWWVVWNA